MESFLNSKIPGSRNFIYKDSLYLPKWKIYCVPTDAQESQIVITAYKLDQISAYLGRNISIVSWLRPELYNQLIGGAKDSCHLYGMAADFTVEGMMCDDVRSNLETRLDDFKIRMENKPGSPWVHIDSKEVGPKGKRYFVP